MRILLATGFEPFGTSPERELSEQLAQRLRARGHRTEFLRLPAWGGGEERVLMDLLLASSLEVSHTDHVIATSFPAALVPHRSRSAWLLDDGWLQASRAVTAAAETAAAQAIAELGAYTVARPELDPGLGRTAQVLPPGPSSAAWSRLMDGVLP